MNTDTLAWPGQPETAASDQWPGQQQEDAAKWPGTPEEQRAAANPIDLFSYHVATNGVAAVQGLLRGLSAIASDDEKRKVLEDSINSLEQYRTKKLPEYYGVTPEDLKTTAGKVTGAAASVGDMAAGPAIMIAKMAGQTYGDSYSSTERALRAFGITDEDMIREKSREAARNGILSKAPVLAAYALGG
ncbi:MAG: hypothetical protein ABI925_11255, partial [Verrucomicrobiota bacterium]